MELTGWEPTTLFQTLQTAETVRFVIDRSLSASTCPSALSSHLILSRRPARPAANLFILKSHITKEEIQEFIVNSQNESKIPRKANSECDGAESSVT